MTNIANPNNVPALSKPISIGAPYHGLITEGKLPINGGGELSGLVDTADGWNISLSNPNRVLPERTSDQEEVDISEGKEYRDYALVPGRRVYGTNTAAIGNAESIYFDSKGYTWRVDFSGLSLNRGSDTITGNIKFTRFLHIGQEVGQKDTVTVPVSFSNVGLGYYKEALDNGRTFLSGTGLLVADFVKDGSKVLIYDYFPEPTAIWEIELSDTINEGGSIVYPYEGGTVTFSAALNVVHSSLDVWDGNHEWTDSVNTVDDRVNGAGPLTITSNGSYKVDRRIVWANYDLSGDIVTWYYSVIGTYSSTSVEIINISNTNPAIETVTVDFSVSRDITVELYRGLNRVDFFSISESDSSFTRSDTESPGTELETLIYDRISGSTSVSFSLPELNTLSGGQSFESTSPSGVNTTNPTGANFRRIDGAIIDFWLGRNTLGVNDNPDPRELLRRVLVQTNADNPHSYSLFYEVESGYSENLNVGEPTFRNHSAVRPLLDRFGSNKLIALTAVKFEYGFSIAQDNFPGTGPGTNGTTPIPTEIIIRKVHSPESTHDMVVTKFTKDQEFQLSTARVEGCPVAYDPENDVFEENTYIGAESRFKSFYFV